MSVITTADVRRLYSRADRERLTEKFRQQEKEKAFFWQYKPNPYGGNTAANKVVATLHQLDRLAASTIKRYGTDWARYDRKTAMKRLCAGKSFVFLPRDTGCYVVWPDAWAPERDGEEYSPGFKSNCFHLHETIDRTSSERFLYVDARDFYILESEPQCHTFMAEAPDYIVMRHSGKDNPYVILKRRDGRTKPYEAVTGYDEALGTGKSISSFETLDGARYYVEQKELEILSDRLNAAYA